MHPNIEINVMHRNEQEIINSIATDTLKQNRSREEIIKDLQSAGIIGKDGEIVEPYTEIFKQK